VIQEELNQCEKIRSAMAAVQERLRRLAITIQNSDSDAPDEASHGGRVRYAQAVVGASDSELAQIVSFSSIPDEAG
jgi:hypothetical protein